MKTKQIMKTNGKALQMTRAPQITCKYIEEPSLLFAEGYQHIDPRYGILAAGPKSYAPLDKHPSQIRVGLIGSAETMDKARQWIERGADGVDGDENYLRFPGFKNDRGFRSDLLFDDDWLAQLYQTEIDNVMNIRYQRERFDALIDLLDEKLKLLADKDRPPEYVVLALPDDVYQRCRVADYIDKELGRVHRDLRRVFKVRAMKYRLPTQILRQLTIEDRTGDVIPKIYWNFFTGLYFKAGGSPWGPIDLTPGSCYVGISFFRPIGTAFTRMQTSLVQAFDEHGDGLVLRGYEFDWDSDQEGTPSPHLTEEQAHQLIELVLDRYIAEMGQTPQRVVVHKTSRYWPQERKGITDALRKYVRRYDLMALAPQSIVRLITTNKYPPLRGTHFSVEDIDYLYTTGYVSELGKFHGMHVPSPIQIADHIGQDTPRNRLLKEILILTKMNWNSSRLGGLMPITIRFSRLVGDIMREIPATQEPLTNFKYYM